MIDGPFAETKEQLLGFYIVDCAYLEEALDIARELGQANPGGAYEIRPIACSLPGAPIGVTDLAWIDAALTSARPQAVGALLRYFRDLDTAEEAFQEACLRALKTWPQNGPPRDPAAWLIFVGRNVAIDDMRRRRKQEPLPDEEALSDLDDAETALAERLDDADYRDDILRLLFICCHPDLPATSRSRWRCASSPGLSVKQIARAFLVGESAMEQRITRAKRAHRPGRGALRGAGRRGARGAPRRGRGDDLPALQRGLFGQRRRRARPRRRCARRPSGSRACCCGCFQTEPEIMGLTALHAAAACPRPGAARCRRRDRAARGSGSRPVEPRR